MFTQVNVGTNLREVLTNDMELQRNASTALNDIAEQFSRAHDATSRRLAEDEEQRLYWLESEIDLLDRLGEQHYTVAG